MKVIKNVATFFLAIACILNTVLIPGASITVSAPSISAVEYISIQSRLGMLDSDSILDYGELHDSEFTINNDGINIKGTVGNTFDVFALHSSGKVTHVYDKNHNFQVLAILNLGNELRIVLKPTSKNNIVYLNCKNIAGVELQSYNANWYGIYTNTPVNDAEDGLSPSPMAETIAINRSYKTETNVFGDLYIETLKLLLDYTFPDKINNSTGGEFICSMTVLSNDTRIEEWDGDTYDLPGSSLYVYKGSCSMSTPKGEYINYITPMYSVTATSSPSIKVNYAIGIPKTNISLDIQLPQTERVQSGTQKSFNSNGSAGLCVKMDIPGKLSQPGDYASMLAKIDTNKTYQVLGNKSIQTRWDVTIISSGSCHGTAVDSYYMADRCNRQLTYRLVSA